MSVCPQSSDFGDIYALSSPFWHQLTVQSSLLKPGRLRPCPSYSRRRDRISLGLLRSYYKWGGGVLYGAAFDHKAGASGDRVETRDHKVGTTEYERCRFRLQEPTDEGACSSRPCLYRRCTPTSSTWRATTLRVSAAAAGRTRACASSPAPRVRRQRSSRQPPSGTTWRSST